MKRTLLSIALIITAAIGAGGTMAANGGSSFTNKELDALEKAVLHKDNKDISVYVSLKKNSSHTIDSISVKLAGKKIAQHVYSAKELKLLRSGAIQHIYSGMLHAGIQKMEVVIRGRLKKHKPFKETASYKINKAAESKYLEIILGSPGTQDAIRFTEN